MMRPGQYSIPSKSEFPTTPRPHAASRWTPTSQQSSSSNRQGRGTMDRRNEETLRVIETREGQRPSPYGTSSRVSSRTMEQGPLQRGPQTKLLTYEGQEDIDVFLVPFERLAERYAWSEMEKIDRLYESLKGKAMWYVCSLPRALTGNYRSLRESLTKRFGRKDPPSTVRRKLAEMRQKGESNDEFGEEVRRLVTRAYPGTDLEMQDQLAAEAFLRGYRNSRIAYDVLNRAPRTLNDALELVTSQEHNYKATLGRDYDQQKRERARRVSWAEETDESTCAALEEEPEILGAQRVQRPTYVTIEQLDNRLKQVELRLKKSHEQEKAKRDQLFKDLENRCYQCGQTGHYKSECKSRPLSSRPQERALEPVKEDVSEKLDQIKCTRIHSVGRGIVVPVNVNNKECSGVIDTGADATVISSAFARDARIDISNCKKARLMIAENGAEMTVF